MDFGLPIGELAMLLAMLLGGGFAMGILAGLFGIGGVAELARSTRSRRVQRLAEWTDLAPSNDPVWSKLALSAGLREGPYHSNVQKNRAAISPRKAAKHNSSLRREMPCAMRTPRGAARTETGIMIIALTRETNPSEPGGNPSSPHPAQIKPIVPGMAIIGPKPEDVPTA